MAADVKRISTHILDLTCGKPARDVIVRLERQSSSGAWDLLTAVQTDSDGRCGQLLPEGEDLPAAVYRITFETAGYFAAQKIEPLYPEVQIVFRVRTGETHFHIPLLLSPNGYTTYRGS